MVEWVGLGCLAVAAGLSHLLWVRLGRPRFFVRENSDPNQWDALIEENSFEENHRHQRPYQAPTWLKTGDEWKK